MKKWLALLLAAMMALALVACGDTPANNDNDNKDNDTKTEEFARGSWDGNVYTNDSLNLTEVLVSSIGGNGLTLAMITRLSY